tara:strand:+ start:188 stop:1150 length:963 start_codon:yes stop_codon:yes gene_type:complete
MEVGTHDYLLKEDVLWASPKGFDLTMDIYTPQTGKDSYPVIVMYHGGGWLINNNSIMDQSAAYLASHGEYVVCNVNYRLLGDLDNTTTLDEIVEDALGAFVWVKYHIADYQGNPNQITVTGDSAGGHLAMMVTQQGTHLSNNGFDEGPNGFAPTWLPEGKQAEELSDLMEVQAAILSYGAFDMYAVGQSGFETSANFFWQMGNAEARGIFGSDKNAETHPDYYKKISPIYNIPSPAEKDLPPMLFTVGELDQTTPAVSIEAFMDKLKEAGHDEMTYWVHEGRPHAFLDSGSNEFLGIVFEEDAIPALEVMLDFLNGVFYE